MISNKPTIFLLTASTLLVAACDLPFLDQEAKIEAKRQAEGMAIGSGCRYSSRALEDCYSLNPKMSKAAIFSGWREMDGYMRENNIEAVAPTPPKKTESTDNTDNAEEKPKAAEATPPAEEKPKAAEVTPPPGKAGLRIHKQPKRVA